MPKILPLLAIISKPEIRKSTSLSNWILRRRRITKLLPS